MPYDYEAAGNYILNERYARNIRDKTGNTFVAIPGTIQENTEATFQTNKPALKAEILADLEPTAVAAEVINAREGYASLDARLDDIGNKVLLGTSTASANFAIKAVTLPGFVLYTGARIAVKFTNGCNTVNGLGINANGTGAKGIQLRGANLTSIDQAWQAGDTVPFVFDGTYYQMEDNSALSKVVARVPVGSMVQQGVTNFFKPTVNQSVTGGQTPTVALAKQVGDLVIDANSYITLPKGFYYEIDFGLSQFVSAGAGALVLSRIFKSDGTAIGHGTDAGSIGATNANGRQEITNSTHLIDLTGAGADVLIKYMVSYVDVATIIK